MQTQLTGAHKDKIRAGAVHKTIDELRETADWFFSNNMPEHGNYLRYIIAEREASGYAFRPDKPQAGRSPREQPNTPPQESKPLIKPEQAKALVLSAGILTGGGLLVAKVVIPVLVVVGSFLYANALLIGGGIVSAAILLSMRSGEKKTEIQTPQPSPGRRIVVTQTTEIYE